MRLSLLIVGIVVLIGMYYATTSFAFLRNSSSGAGQSAQVVGPTTANAIIGVGYLVGILMVLAGIFLRTPQNKMHVKVDSKEEDPVAILKRRYARGDITKEEFNEMKRQLEGSDYQ